MKRFHVHMHVEDMQKSIRFYSTIFGEPAVVKPDYAKWMVEDPRLNFAISDRGSSSGVDHLGIQVETEEELAALRERMAADELPLTGQANASCCYAKSDKWWTMDPQGMPWETYHTLDSIPVYGGETRAGESGLEKFKAGACCGQPSKVKASASGGCGTDAVREKSKAGACCGS